MAFGQPASIRVSHLSGDKFREVYEGPANVPLNDTAVIRGIFNRDIRVDNGATLTVYGIVNGNLKGDAGSTIIVYGIVNGEVKSHYGGVRIYGILKGDIRSTGATILIEEEAIHNGSVTELSA